MTIKRKLLFVGLLPVVVGLVLGIFLEAASERIDEARERYEIASAITFDMFEISILGQDYMQHAEERSQVQLQFLSFSSPTTRSARSMKDMQRIKVPRAWVRTAVGIIALATCLWGCSEDPRDQPAQIAKLTLGVESSLLPAAVWVASEKGYFREEGIDLTIKAYETGKLSFAAMLDGKGPEISTVAPTPIMFTSFERQDFSILATFVYSDDDIKVIARTDQGIAKAADLKGKRIGTPAGTTGQFFLAAYLASNGILTSDVNEVNIAPAKLPLALQRGQVDAIVIWEPHAINARNLMAGNVRRLPSSKVYRETFVLTAMKEFANTRPETLEKFLRVIHRATAFINTHQDESIAIVAKTIGMKEQRLRELWGDYVFELSLDQSLILTLEAETRWAIKNQLTDKTIVPNYLEMIHLNALEAVKPDGVKIIR